jgi:hypothetical protein
LRLGNRLEFLTLDMSFEVNTEPNIKIAGFRDVK